MFIPRCLLRWSIPVPATTAVPLLCGGSRLGLLLVESEGEGATSAIGRQVAVGHRRRCREVVRQDCTRGLEFWGRSRGSGRDNKESKASASAGTTAGSASSCSRGWQAGEAWA